MDVQFPDKLLHKIRNGQWALADIDWEAPGAECITAEQWPKLKAFMADLVWIEHVGARAFASMAKNAPQGDLKEIYTYFHAEEQRHANAEAALMRRWGMLEDDEIPQPNINVRLVIEWLEKYGDDIPLNALASVIPMFEVALDGALLKFLLDTVEDPVCHQVFAKINEDESRHLAAGFHVMELLGHGRLYRLMLEFTASVVSPKLLLGALAFLPLLNRVRDNVVEMGLKEDRLYEAMKRFRRLGGRTADGRRNPWYKLLSWHGKTVVNRNHPYHVPVDALVSLSAYVPRRLLGPFPTWVKELTWKPTA